MRTTMMLLVCMMSMSTCQDWVVVMVCQDMGDGLLLLLAASQLRTMMA
jgi:hypothetical protein